MNKQAKKQQEQLKAWLMEYSKVLPGLNSDCPYPIKKGLNIVNGHFYKNKCKVKWVKQQCNIHRNNFSVRFEHFVGYSPKKYILHHRVEAARQLLGHVEFEDVSIGIISFELGFNSPAAFSHYFKERTGMTPVEWREREKDAL